VNDGIGGGSTFPAGMNVYAYVDSINHATTYGNIRESNEANNVFGPVISTAGSGTIPTSDPFPFRCVFPGRS